MAQRGARLPVAEIDETGISTAPPTDAELDHVAQVARYLLELLAGGDLHRAAATLASSPKTWPAELFEAMTDTPLVVGESVGRAATVTTRVRHGSGLPGDRHIRRRREVLLSSVLIAVARRLDSVSEEDLAQVDPTQVAERVAALIPTPHPFAKLGPFYPTSAVTKWLGLSRQALDHRVKARKMLGCTTSDGGQRVYPVWQFTTDGHIIAHLGEVLDELHHGIDDPWTWATWLVSPVPGRFDSWPAHQWLAAGRDPEPVLTEARRTASRLAR